MGWLFKTEPSTYSFDRLLKEKRARWDGIKNATALIHLRAVKKGDGIFIYHTGDVRAIVGLARAASDPYPDPAAENPRFVAVDIAADRGLGKPVTLDEIKADPVFRGFDLVRLGRLSVVPVPALMWARVLTLAR